MRVPSSLLRVGFGVAVVATCVGVVSAQPEPGATAGVPVDASASVEGLLAKIEGAAKKAQAGLEASRKNKKEGDTESKEEKCWQTAVSELDGRVRTARQLEATSEASDPNLRNQLGLVATDAAKILQTAEATCGGGEVGIVGAVGTITNVVEDGTNPPGDTGDSDGPEVFEGGEIPEVPPVPPQGEGSPTD